LQVPIFKKWLIFFQGIRIFIQICLPLPTTPLEVISGEQMQKNDSYKARFKNQDAE
jgi:hypothetical protein